MPSPFYPQPFTQALVRSKCLRGVFDSLRGRKSSLLLLIPGRLSLSSAGPLWPSFSCLILVGLHPLASCCSYASPQSLALFSALLTYL